MTAAEWQVSSETMARLVARAYASEHPKLFGPNLGRVIGGQARQSSMQQKYHLENSMVLATCSLRVILMCL